MFLEVYPARLLFRANEPIYFPPGTTGNMLRGGFGAALKRTATQAIYARIFEPTPTGPAPSGFADLPRPFVFRTAHLDGRHIAGGELFHFDLHLFDIRDPGLPNYTSAFESLISRATFVSVSGSPLRLSLLPSGTAVRRIKVLFKTPTELKHGAQIVAEPGFSALFARARDRVSALSQYYGSGPLSIDFRETSTRAALVEMTAHQFHRVEAERTSRRTGQTHSLGGIVGEAIYEGDLDEFLPYLRAAQWTGVGRQTVWGKGQIEVIEL